MHVYVQTKERTNLYSKERGEMAIMAVIKVGDMV